MHRHRPLPGRGAYCIGMVAGIASALTLFVSPCAGQPEDVATQAEADAKPAVVAVGGISVRQIRIRYAHGSDQIVTPSSEPVDKGGWKKGRPLVRPGQGGESGGGVQPAADNGLPADPLLSQYAALPPLIAMDETVVLLSSRDGVLDAPRVRLVLKNGETHTGFVFAEVANRVFLAEGDPCDGKLFSTRRDQIDQELPVGEFVEVRIGDIGRDGATLLTWDAIISVCAAIQSRLEKTHGVSGAFVAPDVKKVPWLYAERSPSFPEPWPPLTAPSGFPNLDVPLEEDVLPILVTWAFPAQTDDRGQSLDGPFRKVSHQLKARLGNDDAELSIAHPDLPDDDSARAAIEDMEVELTPTPLGYIAPRGNMPRVRIRIGAIGTGENRLSISALRAIVTTVRSEMERRYGLMGHLVTITPTNVERDQADVPTEHTIRVYRAVVGDTRTVAAGGGRVDPKEQSINRPEYVSIKERSPLKNGDLLREDLLEQQLARVNRHPGRRVDAAIGAMGEPGEGKASVDYLITESKPWSAYGQVSNTGTETTDEWRYRFGYSNTQLTNRDDILQLEYSTAGFEATHAVYGSYDFPVIMDRLRFAPNFAWSEYTSSDLGIGFGDAFQGESLRFGGDFRLNIAQTGSWFVDLVGGFRWDNVRTDNLLADVTGEAEYITPSAGVMVDRIRDTSVTQGSVIFDFGHVTSGADELARLGRLDTDDDWVAVRWNAYHSFFIEPLLDQLRGLSGNAPESLATEIALSFRGQNSLGSRLIPNEQLVAGGFYTVRGYPESFAAGDNVYIGSVELRHYPIRARAPGPYDFNLLQDRAQRSGFRWEPTRPYGSADWDLVLRAFIDFARVVNDGRLSFEKDATLVGTGVGAELRLLDNLNLRLDWGVAVTDAENSSESVEAGDWRLHFAATLRF